MAIGIGVLGFAHGHVNAYCEQWKKQAPEIIRVIAGWDHDAERAAASAKRFEIETAASAANLVARRDVTAVLIGAETSMHADMVKLAANAGKAIVLQKPLACTLEEADRIVAAVERTRVPFTMAWQMRVDPQNVKMKQLIADGVIGRVLMFRRRHCLSVHTWPNFDQTWHVKPELNVGMWADDASHPIDFLHWLLGKPQSVMAEVDTLMTPKIPHDNGIAIFRYGDGTIAEIVCSFTCLAGENTTEIVGEKGVINQNWGDAVSCNLPHPAGATGLKWFTRDSGKWIESDIPSPAQHAERIHGLADPLLAFLRGERAPICDAREGRTSLAMTLACYRSSELGRRVKLNEM